MLGKIRVTRLCIFKLHKVPMQLVTVQAKVEDKTRILCHISTRMHTNAHIFKKLGFTTTIQEYVAERYTRIQNNVKMTPRLL